jgi:hypothetical protein
MMMQYARLKYLSALPFPKTYKVGKFTAIGIGKEGRKLLLDLKGSGCIRRIWTTHGKGNVMKLIVNVDDEPALNGLAHEIAEAASRIICPAIPLGGLRDAKSSNIYFPIVFRKHIQIESEAVGEVGDGPYWQIDYAFNTGEKWRKIKQEKNTFGMQINFEPPYDEPPLPLTSHLVIHEESLELSGASPKTISLSGPAVIRRLEIAASDLDALILRIAFDHPPVKKEHLNGPFQVDAPLRYLVGYFNNVCVERLGTSAVIHFPMPFQKSAGIQLLAAMQYGRFDQKYPVKVRVEYEANPPAIEQMLYFHAQFRSSVTNGRDDFECCSTNGHGHFVGVNLFDTGHDHGGGDNIMFDSGADTAGQLHGICGEDYFHMAYMNVWNRTPYSGCPSHSERYRYHLEMPIPFQESFVFNWGCFAGQPAKAVAFWYQKGGTGTEQEAEMTWLINGPFPLEMIDELSPLKTLPEQVLGWHNPKVTETAYPWRKTAQRGFVDLCHIHRRHLWTFPASTGWIISDVCSVAETYLWSESSADIKLLIGCDDPIYVFLNGERVLSDQGRTRPDPFKLFKLDAQLKSGLNHLWVAVGNTANYNWLWNGFSLRLQHQLPKSSLRFLV